MDRTNLTFISRKGLKDRKYQPLPLPRKRRVKYIEKMVVVKKK